MSAGGTAVAYNPLEVGEPSRKQHLLHNVKKGMWDGRGMVDVTQYHQGCPACTAVMEVNTVPGLGEHAKFLQGAGATTDQLMNIAVPAGGVKT